MRCVTLEFQVKPYLSSQMTRKARELGRKAERKIQKRSPIAVDKTCPEFTQSANAQNRHNSKGLENLTKMEPPSREGKIKLAV